MTPFQRRNFIDELVNNVHSNIVEKLYSMPDDWDGHELRRYVADKFMDESSTLGCPGYRGRPYARRFRAYKNAVLVNNL